MAIAPTFAGNSNLGNFNDVPGAARSFAVTGTVGAADTYVQSTGLVITAAQLGLSKILWMGPVFFSTGHWGFWNGTKIKVFTAGSGATQPAELADASALLQSATFFMFGSGR